MRQDAVMQQVFQHVNHTLEKDNDTRKRALCIRTYKVIPTTPQTGAVLCRAVLCCAVLCCAVLCCAALCCAVLCCAVLCCAVLCCAVLPCHVMSYYVMSCHVMSHYPPACIDIVNVLHFVSDESRALNNK